MFVSIFGHTAGDQAMRESRDKARGGGPDPIVPQR